MWNLIIKAATAFLMLSVVSCTVCSVHQNEAIKDMVGKGANPLEAECAIKNDSLTFCAMLATKTK